MMCTEDRCTCGGMYERDRTCEDYLIWRCGKCGSEELEHFKDVSDDSWEWLREYFCKEIKNK